MKELSNVTLCIADCRDYAGALLALRKSLKHITPSRTIFFTDVDFEAGKDIEVIEIDKISNTEQYSLFIIKELWKHINTDYVIVCQADGYVICGEAWSDEFLEYDFIGASWLFPNKDKNVGNGGASFRSKRLQDILGTDEFIQYTDVEDESICRLYRPYLERKYGIKFAPMEVADKFSFELNPPYQKTFMFHGGFHQPFKDHVVIRRQASLGDICMLEPVLTYYNDLGYQVVLDTEPQFMSLFFQHNYHIKHISQMDSRINPIKDIDLNMAYELKPKIPVLKAYCEKAGIDIPLRNSRLNISITPEAKLFNNYILIHADSSGIPHRDINDLDWSVIVKYLQLKGFQVFQVGKRTEKEVAPHLHTETIEMLMYVVKGADLLIGLDSGIAQIAVALGVPSVIMAGSVDLKLRYNDFANIRAIQGKCPSEDHKFCYHKTTGSTTGTDCVFSKHLPPCTFFDKDEIINAINTFL